MQEDLSSRTLPGRAIASQEVAPAWMISDVNTARAIQAVSSALGRAPVDVEIAPELQVGLAGCREELSHLAASDSDSLYSEESAEDEEEQRTEAKARTRSRSSNEPQEVPAFPRRFAEDVPQECLQGDATSPQNSSIWTISAPEIEQGIRRLYAKCGRAPTELEIAAELGTDLQFYRETLSHLKDLEIGVLYSESNPGSERSGISAVLTVPSGGPGAGTSVRL
jgi:DNA-directed RNA polymerase specialized sigma subunit